MNYTFSIQDIRRVASHRPAGYVEDVLSHAVVDGDTVTLTHQAYAKLAAKYRNAGVQASSPSRAGPPPTSQPPAPTSGPGTELKKLLKKIGITTKPGCACNKRAQYMDKMGPDWCDQNMDQIVGWLKEEHARQKVAIPFVDAAVRLLVKYAIRKARKKANSQ